MEYPPVVDDTIRDTATECTEEYGVSIPHVAEMRQKNGDTEVDYRGYPCRTLRFDKRDEIFFYAAHRAKTMIIRL